MVNIKTVVIILKILAKVNNTETAGFVLKTRFDTDKSDLEKKNS